MNDSAYRCVEAVKEVVPVLLVLHEQLHVLVHTLIHRHFIVVPVM